MTRESIKKSKQGKAAAPAARPSGRRRGRPSGNVLDRRDLILTAALKLFAVRGYERTGLHDVARATGITRPAIYHYYNSKGQLLFEAVGFALGQLMNRLRQVDASAFTHPAQHLAMLVRMQASFEIELRGVTPFMDSVLYGPLRDVAELTAAQKTELRNSQRQLVEIYRKVLQDGKASGALDVSSPTVTAFSILGMVSHLAVWYREEGELTSEAVATLMSELAQRLVLKPASAA
ncbi:TetR/AcrR family transcriptional regulator [Peristeroidobacter agariperforans]|uniref:TetR/AcrR family transcriptional regulator n=1 Tax=Peristeroidobacter agariperforans TaxID=268404 RepID=UPI00101C72E8|nr:TetR/AcrR family transcriptional regulator [Peristeroidobacter agariperforans]